MKHLIEKLESISDDIKYYVNNASLDLSPDVNNELVDIRNKIKYILSNLKKHG